MHSVCSNTAAIGSAGRAQPKALLPKRKQGRSVPTSSLANPDPERVSPLREERALRPIHRPFPRLLQLRLPAGAL